MGFLTRLSGYRTYLSATATILMSVSATLAVIATTFGGLDIGNGVMIAAACAGLAKVSSSLAQIFQRAATATSTSEISSLLAEIDALRKQISTLTNVPRPNFPPLPPDPPLPNFPPVDVRGGSLPGKLLGLILCVLLAESLEANALEPKAIIAGPKVAEAGEEIILDASTSEGDPKVFAWRIYPRLDGRKQLTVLEGGKSVRVASFPGRYMVRLMVANSDGISDHDHTITIPGPTPCPPAPEPSPGPAPGPVVPPVPNPVIPVPGPQPTPGPVPVPPVPPPAPPVPVPVPVVPDLPPGEFDGLPSAIKALALSVVSVNRAAEAAKLADSFEALNAQIAAGAIKTPFEAFNAVHDAFDSSTTPAWDDGFRTKAVRRMESLYKAGKLATVDRWRAMLTESVTGLRAVK